MDFDLSEEQRLLKESLDRLIGDRYAFEQRRSYAQSPEGWSRALWAQYAELGLLGLPFAEHYGGSAGGPVETMIAMEAFGRALALEPFLATVVLCGGFLRHGGSAQQCADLIPKIADGSLTLAFAHTERHSRYDLSDIETRAVRDGAAWVLDGEKGVVLHGDTADKLIVTARVGGGRRDRDGVGVFIAEAVGAMAAMHELTVDYLKTRRQFGREIGTFQILQHRAVDMLIALEQARSMAMLATMMAAEENAAERRNALSAAKVQIGRSGKFVGQQAIQLHGGIGMTMEYKVGHYFKRVTMIDTMFGDADYHLRELARRSASPAAG